jgi:transcriptional regulator with XRE-family HTH domain
MQTLGTYLRALRGKRRISLRRVAAKARISAEYLSDIELGRRHPSDRVLAELATALNTSVDDLRRHDPKALISDIQKRVDEDVGYADALTTTAAQVRDARRACAILSNRSTESLDILNVTASLGDRTLDGRLGCGNHSN